MATTAQVNDLHSGLNATDVQRVLRPTRVQQLQRLVRATAAAGESLAISGSRHAMGGQQFLSGAPLLDMRGLHRVTGFDFQRGLVRAEAGIEWPALVQECARLQGEQSPGQDPEWGITQKQTGADRLTLGGALASNVHGRGLKMGPIVGDVESFSLVRADGELVMCSREQNAELFALAIGGYGLFGPIAEVTLRLGRRAKLRRVVRVIDIEDAVHAARRRIDAGFMYGDFQFDIDAASPSFLTRGVFACYEPVPLDTPMPARRDLGSDDWLDLIALAHTDKRLAFQKYAQHYLASDGQVYWSDEHQFTVYVDGYHGRLEERLGGCCAGSEMITELYMPPERLVDFLRAAARLLARRQAQVIYGTIRLIMKDAETVLAWAREASACVIFNLHVEHTRAGLEHASGCFRALIDLALERGGSFYLTYHRFARADQLLRAYPRLREFLAAKHRYDPAGVFSSDWHRWLERSLEDRECARIVPAARRA